MSLNCFSLVDRQIERQSDRRQLGIKDPQASSTQKDAAGPPLILMVAHNCGSHLAIV
jgi:hypothetical protein